jgi:hypothetical protein
MENKTIEEAIVASRKLKQKINQLLADYEEEYKGVYIKEFDFYMSHLGRPTIDFKVYLK